MPESMCWARRLDSLAEHSKKSSWDSTRRIPLLRKCSGAAFEMPSQISTQFGIPPQTYKINRTSRIWRESLNPIHLPRVVRVLRVLQALRIPRAQIAFKKYVRTYGHGGVAYGVRRDEMLRDVHSRQPRCARGLNADMDGVTGVCEGGEGRMRKSGDEGSDDRVGTDEGGDKGDERGRGEAVRWQDPDGRKILNTIVKKEELVAPILDRDDIFCCTATGDGKSAAFSVPILVLDEYNSNRHKIKPPLRSGRLKSEVWVPSKSKICDSTGSSVQWSVI
ncbi:hypothetical protein C8F04DRAFT_1183485 [Mycena alexandri]|uniref:DEAD/DEAH box helicase domain-containing protein n=1 Tax=Mycena alexandri TaxID=1745969 RepID=A0AAD6SUV0_9AGAR|nr:hypothetical protein C8F04DRAFT_1183485 [Mycena alexandri]